MNTDFDLDIDDIFNDLEAHVENLSNEDIFDKFDRLREQYEHTFQDNSLGSVRDVFEKKCDALARRLFPAGATIGSEPAAALTRYTYGKTYWLEPFMSSEMLFLSEGCYLGGSREIPSQAVQDAILETMRQMKDEADAIIATKTQYDAVRKEIADNLIEGCYVSFRNPAGHDKWGDVTHHTTGFGVLIGITEKTYVIQIDRNRTGRDIKGHTARIKIETAFESVYKGGRHLSLEWGPRGWAREADRRRERELARQRVAEARARARERMERAWAEYHDLQGSWHDYDSLLRRIETTASQDALAELIAAHDDEYRELLERHTLRVSAFVDEARPLVQLGPEPSHNVDDYMDEESE